MAGRRKKRLDWHEDALDELAEALAWYEELNPAAARRMKSAILAAAASLVAEPVSVPGRPGILAGTRERPVGHRVPFTLVSFAVIRLATAPSTTACTRRESTSTDSCAV